MTHWWNEQTANQRLLDMNRELREEVGRWIQRHDDLLALNEGLVTRTSDLLLAVDGAHEYRREAEARVEFLETENAMLEADNAKLTAGLHYNPNDAW